jgi:predicted  nucleic acid-binding Zn-ribbon protein
MKKSETKVKKVDSETMTVGEIKRHMTALSEDFRGRVKAIGEQFSGLNKKLDAHDEQFKKIDGQFRVVHHTLGAMKEDMEVMKEDLSIIKADVRKRVTYEEFESLSKRVILLEKKSHRLPLK